MKTWPRATLCIAGLSIACLSRSPLAVARNAQPTAKNGCVVRLEGFSERGRCGTKGYTRVFVGTVRSAVKISETDKRLDLIPDEVFAGDSSELTASVNQACLPKNEPEIKAGDRWLFYVRPKSRPDEIRNVPLEVPFYSRSKPASQAEGDIAVLRELSKVTDKGILTGKVVHIGPTYDDLHPTPVAHHKVVAKSLPSGLKYQALTDQNGRFEFELPPGSYVVSAATQRGLREIEPSEWTFGANVSSNGEIPVANRTCSDLDFSLIADGKLAGRVKSAKGNPASFVKVAIIPILPVHPQFVVQADKNGRFEAAGLQPGQYIVGVGLLAPFDSSDWKSRVYYPGVASQAKSKVIKLAEGEWRTDVNFSLRPATGSASSDPSIAANERRR